MANKYYFCTIVLLVCLCNILQQGNTQFFGNMFSGSGMFGGMFDNMMRVSTSIILKVNKVFKGFFC